MLLLIISAEHCLHCPKLGESSFNLTKRIETVSGAVCYAALIVATTGALKRLCLIVAPTMSCRALDSKITRRLITTSGAETAASESRTRAAT